MPTLLQLKALFAGSRLASRYTLHCIALGAFMLQLACLVCPFHIAVSMWVTQYTLILLYMVAQ